MLNNYRLSENNESALLENSQDAGLNIPGDGSTSALLDIFQDKARYSLSDRNAFLAYKALRSRLNDIEVTEINVAWSNTFHDGPSELDRLCNRLKQKYSFSFS
ncbi:MAG: hypothetical protein WCA84_04225 [Ignavibacteriaceae bacterium]|jgi:hypothetical protein